jgi:hypothetical protein
VACKSFNLFHSSPIATELLYYTSFILNFPDRADWSSCIALDLYSGSKWCESRLVYQLSCLKYFVVFLSLFRRMSEFLNRAPRSPSKSLHVYAYTICIITSPGQVMWDLWWTKWHGAGFLRSTSVSLSTLIPPTAPHSLILSSTLYALGTDGEVE